MRDEEEAGDRRGRGMLTIGRPSVGMEHESDPGRTRLVEQIEDAPTGRCAGAASLVKPRFGYRHWVDGAQPGARLPKSYPKRAQRVPAAC